MIILILAFIVSLVPVLALFFWLRNRLVTDESAKTAHKKLCDKALTRGMLAVLPIVLLSAITNVLLRLTKLQDTNPLLYEAFYTFIVLAFVEELVKFLTFQRVLKKSEIPYSWLDATVLMTIVGIGFGLIESLIYVIGASVPIILVRGVCMPHAGIGYITGYYYGKSMKTGKPFYKWFGFGLAWFLHGLYDFSLSEQFAAINESLIFVALLLALLDIVLVILLIRFARKARKQELYSEPLSA